MHAPFDTDALRLTGTLVAQHFRFRCDRQLRYDLVPEAERDATIPRRNSDPAAGPLVGARPGMELLTEAGRRWERRKLAELIRRFGSAAVRSAGRDENGDPLRLEYPEVVAALREPGDVRFLVQPELRVRDAEGWARRFGLDPHRVRIAPAQPDLIRIGRSRSGRTRFGVIDIKWSREATTSHFAQVAFYTLLLEEICRAEGIPAVVNTRWGWIWTRGSRPPVRFALAAYRHHVAEFLEREVPRVASAAPEAAAWHVAPRCGGCVYLEHCAAQADAADDLSRVPGLTPLAKEVLAERRIRTVRELAGSFRKDTYSGCHALEANSTMLKQRAQALRYGKIFDVESETLLMGEREATRVLLSAESDPVSGTCFAVGIGVQRGAAKPKTEVFLSTAGTPAGERAMLADALASLADTLERAAGEQPEQGRGRGRPIDPFHLFLFDRGELDLLRGAIDRHLSHPPLHPLVARVSALLFPPAETEQARAAGPPGTLLVEAVAELFALPVPYAYTLAAVSRVLVPAEGVAAFAPRAGYSAPFSSQVPFERIHNVWTDTPFGGSAPAEVAAEIRAVVAAKLAALDSVVRAVRERVAKRPLPRLRMHGAVSAPPGGELPIAEPMLESLRMFAQMEAAAEALSVRMLHSHPARERARRFECIRGLELVERRENGHLVFEFDAECREAKFRPGDFALVLTNEDTDGLLDTDRRPWTRRKLMMALVEYDLAASPPRVVLAPGSGFAKAEAEGLVDVHRRCVLDRALTDFNTRRVVATLRHLASGGGESARILQMLDGASPVDALPLDAEAAWADLLAMIGAAGAPPLNPEQMRAWRAVFERSVSVVWGPPGTGKTYLLAWMLIGLAAAARRSSRTFRILVSAATHRAIVNVLVRISREVEGRGIVPAFRAVKLAGSGSEADRDLDGSTAVEVIDDTRLPAVLAAADAEGVPVVVGSTVWSLWKRMRAANAATSDDAKGAEAAPVHPLFDVVVIDEASQMKVGDALIALSSIRVGGRVILCGDDRQLAPVIRGRYRGNAGTLFGSVFEHFAERRERLTLRESRRMNRALVEYPRDAFYPGLVSMCPEHRIQRMEPPELDAADALLWELFFDPEDAVVFCTYDGVRATARNPFEASLAARLARLARRSLVDPATGHTYSAASFVAQGLAVISPHRAQNSAILAELQAIGFAPAELPVVDTVERMQGNEREMVIVSYAVADGEYAEREAEFLLNPNRFNVSITRPRGKLVLFVSEQVLRAMPHDERVMTESMAIKGYAAHCADGDRTVDLPWDGGEPVQVRVRTRRLQPRPD